MENTLPGRNVRLLIADDNPRARHGLQALLSTQPGVEVIASVCNGQEAIHQTETLQPEVVVLDAHMPVIDGLEATWQIKRRWPQIRVIILTMYPLYEADALSAGADFFLIKDSPHEDLVAAILGFKNGEAVTI